MLGDAFGETFFVNPATVESLIAERALARGPWRWTDDTAMGLSIVEVLERRGAIDQGELALAFGRRYRADPSRGYGPAAHRILGAIGAGEDWRDAARAAFSGMGSLGNGGAMRAGPVGAYFADDLARAAREAALSAEVTHAHPEGIAGAVGVAVAAALTWQRRAAWPAEPGELLEEIAAHVPLGDTRDGLLRAASVPASSSVASAAALLGNGSRVTAPDTVPFAVWAAARFGGASWEEALWHTVSALGDRDTTCAIVGSILALAHGSAGFPATWLAAREPLPDETRWVLHRLDDNGNRFEVATFPTREAAEAALREYEARGHKQTYWVAPRQPFDS